MRKFEDLTTAEQDELRMWHEKGQVQWLDRFPPEWTDKSPGTIFLEGVIYRVNPATIKPRCIQFTSIYAGMAYRVTTTPGDETMLDGYGVTPEEAYRDWEYKLTCNRSTL